MKKLIILLLCLSASINTGQWYVGQDWAGPGFNIKYIGGPSMYQLPYYNLRYPDSPCVACAAQDDYCRECASTTRIHKRCKRKLNCPTCPKVCAHQSCTKIARAGAASDCKRCIGKQ